MQTGSGFYYVANDSCLFARNELTTSNASHSGSGWFARVELMQCTMYTSLINTNPRPSPLLLLLQVQQYIMPPVIVVYFVFIRIFIDFTICILHILRGNKTIN